ncbi:MAG: hypothetical protein PHX62_02080, partial [Bacilli bacterium]|nr:hypothetical protein [Bacilli bacterium]
YNNYFVTLKDYIVNNMQNLFDYVFDHLQTWEIELENVNQDYFDQLIIAVYNSEDIFALTEEQPLIDLNEFLVNSLYELFLSDEERCYEDIKKRIMDSSMEELDSLHQEFLLELGESKEYYLDTISYNFAYEFYRITHEEYIISYYFLEIDEEKALRWNYIDELWYFLDELSQDATPTSILEMESICLAAVAELEIEENAELNDIFFGARAAMEAAFVKDLERLAYLEYFEDIYKMVEFIDNVMHYISDYDADYLVFEELTFALIEDMKATTTIAELSDLYEDYLVSISELYFRIYDSNFMDGKDLVVQDLNEILDDLLLEGVEETSEEYLELVDIRNQIAAEYYLITFFELYFDFQMKLKELRALTV